MQYPHFLQTFHGNQSSIYPNFVMNFFCGKMTTLPFANAYFISSLCVLSPWNVQKFDELIYMWFIFTTMKVEAKFHDSCFGFIWRVMTSEEGYLDLDVLGPSPNEENNHNFLNEKKCFVSLSLYDLDWRVPMPFVYTCW